MAEKAETVDAPKRPSRAPNTIETYKCKISRDSAGVAYIEEEGDDTVVELPKSAMNVSVYLKGKRETVLGIGWIGYFGKGGTNETIPRIIGKVLNSVGPLAEFRLLSGIERVQLGEPAGGRSARVKAAVVNDAEFGVQVHLIGESVDETGNTIMTPVGAGVVGVRVDLQNANPAASGKLLFHFTPEESIEPVFDTYRASLEKVVMEHFVTEFGAEALEELSYDIVLDSVSNSIPVTLTEIGSKIGAWDLAATQVRPHSS